MPVVGAIADDFTGATDLANTLVHSGFRTAVTIGVPDHARAAAQAAELDAVVVALKSRTIPAADAVAQSRAALDGLRELGCARFYFKYCSTFDSTDAGNIGPVADALLDALGADRTIVCPAFPENGRTVYMGNLFVGERPLAESPMRHHPLTPMTDSDLVRVLGRQTPSAVAALTHPYVRAGAAAVRARVAELAAGGARMLVTDAITDDDLRVIAAATEELPLVTGGSGLAIGMAGPYAGRPEVTRALTPVAGGSLILAGSASEATRRQVAYARERYPSAQVRVGELRADYRATVDGLARWVRGQGDGPVLLYSVATLDDVAAEDGASELVERAVAECARRLAGTGVRRLVVAGGETSGAVIAALGVESLVLGPQIDPGVAWANGRAGDTTYAVALKSGNFGGEDFLAKAWSVLP